MGSRLHQGLPEAPQERQEDDVDLRGRHAEAIARLDLRAGWRRPRREGLPCLRDAGGAQHVLAAAEDLAGLGMLYLAPLAVPLDLAARPGTRLRARPPPQAPAPPP